MTSELFAGIYARGGVAEVVSDRGWLQAILDVEAALARACEAEGLIPPGSGDQIAAGCTVAEFDLAELGRETAEHASPIVPIASRLRERFAEAAHHGATSQDILDTAAMVLAKEAVSVILKDARRAADAAAGLAAQYRDKPIAGRTLLQQAKPTTFGLVAAGWMSAIDDATSDLKRIREDGLAVQMGGPVGQRSPLIAERVAADLGLAVPLIPWQANRLRPAQLAAGAGQLAGVMAKPARDVALLAQTEVGEVRPGDPKRGRSSAMPHKRNPVAAVSALACWHRVPGLVATMVSALAPEHQRAAGSWQAEWGTMSELLTLTGSCAAWVAELLECLVIDPERMRSNIAVEGDLESAGELVDRALAARPR